MTQQYRASFDAAVAFSNGGGLQATGFRIDIPGPEVSEDDVAALLVASLGLLMTESVALQDLRIFAESHKGTRGGPSDPALRRVRRSPATHFVELSHVIRAGETTYPGLPVPEIAPHLTREASRGLYAEGTEFAIDRISMVGNTGTYLDSPFHRYPTGADLAGLSLAQLVDLPFVVIRTEGSGVRGVDVGHLAPFQVEGCAVLLHTGGDRGWGQPSYAQDAPYLTEAGARWLVDHGAALVGIDSVNIDDIGGGGTRPAHTVLLAAGIPIVEHLTALGDLPAAGGTFSAAPPLIEAFGTFPVRAYATIPVH